LQYDESRESEKRLAAMDKRIHELRNKVGLLPGKVTRFLSKLYNNNNDDDEDYGFVIAVATTTVIEINSSSLSS